MPRLTMMFPHALHTFYWAFRKRKRASGHTSALAKKKETKRKMRWKKKKWMTMMKKVRNRHTFITLSQPGDGLKEARLFQISMFSSRPPLHDSTNSTGWEDMDQEDKEGEDDKEADVVEVEVTEEIDLQSERVSKPVRDVRKRVDATRILTTEDFQLIGTSLFLLLSRHRAASSHSILSI